MAQFVSPKMPPVRKSDSNPAKPTKKVYSKLKFKMSPGMTGFLVMGNRSKEKRSLSEAVQLLTDVRYSLFLPKFGL